MESIDQPVVQFEEFTAGRNSIYHHFSNNEYAKLMAIKRYVQIDALYGPTVSDHVSKAAEDN